jgi:hypothetical protein
VINPSSPRVGYTYEPLVSLNPGTQGSELVQRLLADVCELCGSTDRVEVHHVRALKDLNPKGRKHPPEWATRMASRRRKTLIVCRACHEDVHAGRPTRQPR